jgi:hypothetical protein
MRARILPTCCLCSIVYSDEVANLLSIFSVLILSVPYIRGDVALSCCLTEVVQGKHNSKPLVKNILARGRPFFTPFHRASVAVYSLVSHHGLNMCHLFPGARLRPVATWWTCRCHLCEYSGLLKKLKEAQSWNDHCSAKMTTTYLPRVHRYLPGTRKEMTLIKSAVGDERIHSDACAVEGVKRDFLEQEWFLQSVKKLCSPWPFLLELQTWHDHDNSFLYDT